MKPKINRHSKNFNRSGKRTDPSEKKLQQGASGHRGQRSGARTAREHSERATRTHATSFDTAASSRMGKDAKPLMVWGKHVVEAFLEKLMSDMKNSVGAHQHAKGKHGYLLHILVEKSGKAPSQLDHACEIAKAVGVKIITHRAMSEAWPLADARDDIVHQRICLQIPKYPVEDISTACELIKTYNEEGRHVCAGLVLDQVQDPRNFGAILRTAAFFGVKFVVYGQNRQADVSPLVLKASSGGAFNVQLIPVININRALEELKTAGAWILGTANSSNATPLQKVSHDRVWVCVLGNEEQGMRSEVLKNCDVVAKIPGGIQSLDSLNVSVTAGILMHALQEQSGDHT